MTVQLGRYQLTTCSLGLGKMPESCHYSDFECCRCSEEGDCGDQEDSLDGGSGEHVDSELEGVFVRQ